MTADPLKAAVATTARMLSAAGLVEAFGHVSARIEGDGFLITPTSPMFVADPTTIVTVNSDDVAIEDPLDASPLEIFLHGAIYRSRPDVSAICRGHGPAMVRWGLTTRSVPLLHGLGAIAGEVVPVHPDLNLIASGKQGEEVAATLGANHGVLLLANGGLAVGRDLSEAATRLWFLEERVAVALDSGMIDAPTGDWVNRLTYTAIELERAKSWFLARFHLSDNNPDAEPTL
jgi:HCOMODA/2-hydroxy-3-carboxy-muconic semialdehyde decarboxylase